MTPTDPKAVPASQYHVGHLNTLVRQELSDFWTNITTLPLSRDQELRGALIAWFCVFTPDLINDECRTLLHAFYEKARLDPDYDTSGWFKILPIELALYGITRDQNWLQRHKRNFAYGGAGLRCYVMESLSLVAPELSSEDQELLDRVEQNLSAVHGACEWGAAMMMVGKGQRKHKIQLLSEWGGKFRLNPREKAVLDELAANGCVLNRYFLPHYFRVQTYIIQRLCAAQALYRGETTASPLFTGSIAEQVGRHPLMQEYVEIPP